MGYDTIQTGQEEAESTTNLNLGNVLPSFGEQQQPATHLYVSISELIMEKIFFHPNYASMVDSLDTVELEAINAILGEQSASEFFVETLVNAIKAANIASYDTVRLELNDANSYEMSALLGGGAEPDEVNPCLGLRGVSRFASDAYKACFALECEVIKRLRADGINVEIVVPCVRALSDAAKIIDRLAEQGLPRGLNGLKVLFACDTPSAVLLSERLLQYFDGLVIKVESLTQLTLGVDINQEELVHLYDPQNEAVLKLIKEAVTASKEARKPVLLTIGALDDYPVLKDFIAELGRIDVYSTAA
ncbi:putative PEP-binding protein [Vibrio mediterranei]|uniref:Phosphoenolpyruvate synthase n=1 Tax=Vibrio mediterranei TaxID=689 RepID=A0AAJ3QJI4_9VIBR|nr:putative PEP-binding protein [Vibrio mediterranei]ASI90999.1 phosphoenolpyruvate synthase [Vibrio mediterranei]MCG9626591.1 phosphoenolpyruvate synthase [Vibrio mediterranei]MCG9660863.1 phosphoenolpyruvate synthase [Vibrio mediterranei]MCG9661619.1 phosphoenolpyruvate synthase [Vibrio mediterranei]PCD87003.1 phosphoenolpyruvate synthase [Vibrio mediterranei]